MTQILSGVSRNETWEVYADLNNSNCNTSNSPAPTNKIATIPISILSAIPSITNIIATDANTGLALGSVSKKKQFGIQATINSKPVALDCNTSIDGVLAHAGSISGGSDSNQSMLSRSGPLPTGSHAVVVSCTNKSSGTAFTGTGLLSLGVIDLPPTTSGLPRISPSTGAYNNIKYSCSTDNMQINDEDDSDANITKYYSWTLGSQLVGSSRDLNCTPSICKIGSALTCSVRVSDPGGGSATQTSTATLIESRLAVKISNENTISTSEGAKVSFNPSFIGTGTPSGNTRYTWDFGDTNSATLNSSASTPPTISHTFYKKGSGSTTFHVVLSVLDSNGNSATSSVDVLVGEAQLVISVEQPAPDARLERMKPASPLRLLVKLKDTSGNIVSGGTVYATIAGSRLGLKENADKSYAAEYVPKWNDPNSNNVLFDANATINGMPRHASDSSRIVYFDSALFDVNVLEPAPPIFSTTRIGKVRFAFFYSDKSPVLDINASDVKAVWLPTNSELELSQNGNEFSGNLKDSEGASGYVPTDADIQNRRLSLSIEASDRAGNSIAGQDGKKTIDFDLQTYNPDFSIDNSIKGSLSSTFAYGQTARFEASLKKPANAGQIQVYLDSAELGWHKQFSFDSNSGKWVLETAIPPENEFKGSEFGLSVGASAILDGQKIIAAAVRGDAKAKLSNQLEISIVSPNPETGAAVSLSEIRAKINYPNGAAYDADSVVMQVNGKDVNFLRRGELFVANYALNQGKQGLAIVPLLGGSYTANEINLPNLDVKGVSGMDPLLIGAGALLLIIILVAGMLVIRKITHREIAEVKGQRSIGELEQRGAELKNILHNLEVDFMKRRISEEDYRKQLAQYSAEQKEVLAKINVLGSGQAVQGNAPAKPKFVKPQAQVDAPPWIARTMPKPVQEEQKPTIEVELRRLEISKPETAQASQKQGPNSGPAAESNAGEEAKKPEPVAAERPHTEQEERDKIASIASKVGTLPPKPEIQGAQARQESQEPPKKKSLLSANSSVQAEELVGQYKGLVHKYTEEDLFNEITEELGYSAEVANEVIARLRPRK